MTPLFLGLAEAKTARARAAEALGMPIDELPLVIVTLQKMADLMMDGQLRDPRAMAFVPTRRAVDYCNQAREGAVAAPAQDKLRQMLDDAGNPNSKLTGGGGGVFPSS